MSTLACTNLDILNATTNPDGHPFECSCPLHYGGDSKLCDLIGQFYFVLRIPLESSNTMIKLGKDECALMTHNCHTYADCIDEDMGFTCKCWNPFIDLNGDGRNCVDRDECADWVYRKFFFWENFCLLHCTIISETFSS